MSYLIKDTTKQERIELIRSWVLDDEAMDACEYDLVSARKFKKA